MDAVNIAQWAGCLTGVVGTVLLALHNRHSGWGFVAYLFSNVCWFYFGVETGAAGIVVQQIAFTLAALLGLWRWFFVPWRAQGGRHA